MTTTSKLRRPMRALSWALVLGLTTGTVTAQSTAQPQSAPKMQEQNPLDQDLIEQILALQRQLDELINRLSPEARQELHARQIAAEPSALEAVAVPSPEAAAPESKKVNPVTASPAPAPALDPATAPGPLPLLKKRQKRPTCNTLTLLDQNQDGQINAVDRYWRHLFVWVDKNGDGKRQEREIESAFERGVREIATSLETFVRSKGGLGETRIGEQIVLDLNGNGFSERNRRDDGVLLLDATAIRRGQGLDLLGPGDEALAGFQAFRSGLRIREPSGQVIALSCP